MSVRTAVRSATVHFNRCRMRHSCLHCPCVSGSEVAVLCDTVGKGSEFPVTLITPKWWLVAALIREPPSQSLLLPVLIPFPSFSQPSCQISCCHDLVFQSLPAQFLNLRIIQPNRLASPFTEAFCFIPAECL